MNLMHIMHLKPKHEEVKKVSVKDFEKKYIHKNESPIITL